MRVLKKLAIVAISSVLLVVLGEVACRLLLPDDVGREISRTLAAEKAPGGFRVVAVGGSSTAGLPIKEWGFVAQLEELLGHLRPGAELEVANFGRGGRPSLLARKVVERIADREVDVVVVYTGHNEFLFRSGDTFQKRTLALLQESALYRVGNKVLLKLRGPEERPDRILPKTLRPYERDTAWWRERQAGYAENIAAILDACRASGVHVVLCTVAANDREWPPVHEAVAHAKANPDYDADVTRIEALLEEGDAEGALAAAEDALAAWGEDAMMSWLAGRALAALDRGEEAHVRFQEARTLDPYPWRVMPEFNEHLRAQGGRDGLSLVDVQALFRERAPQGLVGFELVSDNCHPTPEGSAIIARAIATALADAGLFLEPGTEVPPDAESLRRFLGTFDEERLHDLRTAYFRENGIYSMKTPFRNYAAAEDWFRRGMEHAPRDWATWANAGANALLAGDRELGIERFREAARLLGRPLDPDVDRPRVPYLRQSAHLSEVDLGQLGP